MRCQTAIFLVTACFAAGRPDPKTSWLEFKSKFGKEYDNGDDEEQRYKTFKTNLDNVDRLQSLDDSATYSYLTPFADLTPEEFNEHHLGFNAHRSTVEGVPDTPVLNATLPDGFDWVSKGAVNPVKNQAQCGSCWAFATVANIEGVNFVKNNVLVSLSEQELIDCDKMDNACGGGLPSNAYKDMIQNKLGLELESAYPYKEKAAVCQAQGSLEKVFIAGWKPISTDEDQIAAALMQYGPLAIGINAEPMQLYFGGIANPSPCDPQALDHGVAIVAFGSEADKKFWKIRNSWGPSWGEKGYYRLIRGAGKCGVNTMVTTATMNSATDFVMV